MPVALVALRVLSAIELVTGLLADDAFSDVRDDLELLRGRLEAKLPTKADGSPFTTADLVAASTAARAPYLRILDRTRDGA